VNVTFSLTARGRVLSWRIDLSREDDEEAASPQGGGYLNARLETADTEPLDEDKTPFGYAITTPSPARLGIPSPGRV
jgi:hypothetical protein